MWRRIARIRQFLARHPAVYWLIVLVTALLVGTSGARPTATGTPVADTAALAALPSGFRGVTVPLGTPPLPVYVGDRVDLVGVAPTLAVLEVGDGWAMIAVPADLVEAAAVLITDGSPVIVLSERHTPPATATQPPPDRSRTG